MIDATSAKEIAGIPLPGRPEFAVSDNAGHIFVNLEDKGLIAVIDVAKGSVTTTWQLAPCVEDAPTGIALDVRGPASAVLGMSQRAPHRDRQRDRHARGAVADRQACRCSCLRSRCVTGVQFQWR